ncbi:hypothetical protein CTEN210_17846 [Chaetoceros tenuissimus]|uniref:Hexosyltransferase n=1 Tax=Chaetoceros tenuissimus TaxID=426638 RepID=A0AAD3HF54_9STRA|nr:hypothetical protein CTEN210_17846 [Chaetoceros tenuissimus]
MVSAKNAALISILSLSLLFNLRILKDTLNNFQGLNKITSSSQKEHKIHSPKFAYAFLLAGVFPETLYSNGAFYGILVANEFFKHVVNSTADIVVMARIHKDSNATTFTPEQEDLFHRAGIKLEYLPKANVDNFFTAMFDKFRLLALTEYDRVMYLDSDVQPTCNLDYIFTNSIGENATLEPNVIRIGKIEATNGGLFMLEPNQLDAERVFDDVHERYKYGSDWDTDRGWYEIRPPDHWDYILDYNKQNTTKWQFYGGDADQGFLYYWTKYVKRSVSILHPSKMEHWRCSEEVRLGKAFDYNSTYHEEESYDRFYENKELRGGWIDHQITHWTGLDKPWLLQAPFLELSSLADMNHLNASRVEEILKYGCAPYLGKHITRRVWFELLSYASRRLKIDLNFTSDFPMKHAELGKWAPKGAKDESKDQLHVKWKR